jgi:DNA/RNA endonuclease YhcR with UshA esterase domain
LKDKAFVQGKSYNIVTEITPDNIVDGGLKPIEFDVIEVEEWLDENDEPIYPEEPEQPVDPENPTPENPFEAVASEWGVVGDLTNWGGSSDIVMYTTPTENLFVAEKVEIKSGAFKIRANKQWNDAKNYGFEAAGKAYADKYYAVITGSGSQNMTPIEYGVYDVYFDLAQKRVALMTPGKAYAEAEDGGDPVVVVEGLKDHAWGLIGSFAGSDWANDVVMTVDGDWAVAKNVTIAKNNEFKFRADKAWTLSYGSACDVVADKTYNTYNNGNNMKFIGETGAYDIYFSLVSAKFYMTVAGAEAPVEPVALATPVVEASVEGNVVTLTWAAVENAAQYSITVGTEMPVFVEETTYVFTGEYETEYTFNVVAVPADEEKFAASEAATAKATTEAEPQPETPVAGSQVSVAKFLEMADTATEYVLTGKVARVVNTQYGNFDLTDETGTIYIYGLASPTGAAQYWAESGVREGDTITVKGKYSVYNNSPQVKNAVYVSHVPAPFVFAEAAAIEADVVEVSISVESNVAWTVSCDAAWVKSYSQSGTNNSDIDIEVEANTTGENRVATFTISGEGVDDFVVTLTQYAAGATDTKGTYTSEDFLKNGTSTGGKYYLEKVNVGGTSYDCLKLGTSSVVGDYTTKAVGESGDLTLSFYAVGWNGKTSKLNVYVDGVKVGETITLKSNSGAANNAPYTITPSDDTDYYSISVPGITETSKIAFETVSGATRAIIFGVQLY